MQWHRFQWLERLDRLDLYWLIAGLLFIMFGSFWPSANEEQYLQLARQFMDPDWIKGSINLTEFPGSRLLYQCLAGTLLKFLSFEHVVFLGRTTLLLLYAWPLSRIYRILHVPNMAVLLHLALFLFIGQSFFALSWIFVSFEPKGLAYVFVFLALLYFVQGTFTKMTLALVAATYFHVLVGFYAFAYLGLAMALASGRFFAFAHVKNLLVYALAISPLVIYLSSAIKVGHTSGVDPNWIYTYFRSPHHTALFKSMDYFMNAHAVGVGWTVVALVLSCIVGRRTSDPALKRLNLFAIASLAGTLLAVVGAYFDRTGVFVKYYPFRINTLSVFVVLLHGCILVFQEWKGNYLLAIRWASLCLAVVVAVRPALANAYGAVRQVIPKDRPIERISEYIRTHTRPDDVILFLNETGKDGDVSLTRRMQRSSFVVRKFIPAEMARINDWYERILWREELAEHPEKLPEVVRLYRVDHVLSTRALRSDILQETTSVTGYHLYAVVGGGSPVGH